MEDIVKAIEKLSQQTWVDYLLISVPIAISIVAIIISIAAARKQNRIALFEMRYKALLQIKTILSFEDIAYREDSPQAILRAFDMFYGTDIRSEDEIVALMVSAQQMKIIEQDIASVSFLLNKKRQGIFDQLLGDFSQVIIDAIKKRITTESKENFHSVCLILKNEVLEKIMRKIKV